MNIIKMDKSFVSSALKIFVLSSFVIVGVHAFFEGYGFHSEYSISRYVGLDYWSWIAFAVCNIVNGELVFRYLAGVRKQWGMSNRWWFCSLWMLLMLICLSICPVGLFDETWGEWGVVSTIHRITSWTMFLLAVLTVIETFIKFRNSKVIRNFGLILVGYGILCGAPILFGVNIVENLALFIEWGFLVAYMAFLLCIPYFETGNKTLDD